MCEHGQSYGPWWIDSVQLVKEQLDDCCMTIVACQVQRRASILHTLHLALSYSKGRLEMSTLSLALQSAPLPRSLPVVVAKPALQDACNAVPPS